MAESWHLKVKRAQRHMVEIRHHARLYSKRHPYEIVRVRPSKRNRNRWRYKIVFTEQPDPMIAVMLGDFVHNLRSALDHMVVACSPPNRRKSASFPILLNDLWARDETGQFLIPDDKGRESFETAIAGLNPHARAVVIAAQPYRKGTEAFRDIFGIISRLENADKHRELITVGTALRNPSIRLILRGDVLGGGDYGVADFFHDNTEVLSFTGKPGLRESEVQVECSGTAMIAIKIAGLGRNEPVSPFPLYKTMLSGLRNVRLLLSLMELHGRSRR